MDLLILTSPEAWIALITLTLLEVVLGIDNIVFISVLASKLEGSQQARARTTGLLMAMLMRIGLLLADRLDRAVDDTVVQLRRAWRLGARFDPPCWRLIPAREGNPRDP